jgi:hypothetical protein
VISQTVSNYMAQANFKEPIASDDSVLEAAQPLKRGAGEPLLNLVIEAAESFRIMEDHVREMEEGLRLAEMRAENAEQSQRELAAATERKLKDVFEALAQARARIEAQEDKLIATEFRAQAAEVRARDAMQGLALAEEAIRRRLLRT